MIGISVIVPIYNTDKYLEKCINSIIRNQYKNIEIVLVNDGSTDNSLTICQKYAEYDYRIKIVNIEKNSGVVNACKQGLMATTMKYISFIDADDYISLSYYSQIVDIINKYDPDVISVGMKKIFSDNTSEIILSNFKGFTGLWSKEYYSLIYENLISAQKLNCELMHFFKTNKIFKREMLIENIQYLNNEVRIFDGYLFCLPVLLDAKSIYFLEEQLYFYRIHNDSAIHTRKAEHIYSNHHFFNTINSLFKNKGYTNRINIFLLSICLSSISRILSSDILNKDKVMYLRTLRNFNEINILVNGIDQLNVTNEIKKTIELLRDEEFYSILKLRKNL